MLDFALLKALEMPLPPEMPRMVEERVLLSDAGVRAQKLADRIVAQYEADTSRWLGTIDTVVSAYSRVPRDDKATAELMETFAGDIAEIESMAEYRADQRVRFAKRGQRDTKRWFKLDPSLGAVSRSVVSRLLAADDKVIAGLLDFALFLRAARAQHNPEPEVSPVFDNPKDMLQSLRAAVAA